MTWNEVKVKYEEYISQRIPATYKRGKASFIKLEKALREFYPAAIAHPELLVDKHNEEFDDILFRDIKKYLTNNDERAFVMVRNIIRIAMSIDNPDKNADYQVFRKKDITACFVRWLALKGWNIIKTDYNESARLDVRAEKDGCFMIVAVISSAWKLREERIYVGGSIPGQLDMDIASLKNRIGKVLVVLMEEINKNPAVTPVILIADDTTSMEYFMPYVPHIKRLNITLYRVKSADEVNEI